MPTAPPLPTPYKNLINEFVSLPILVLCFFSKSNQINDVNNQLNDLCKKSFLIFLLVFEKVIVSNKAYITNNDRKDGKESYIGIRK